MLISLIALAVTAIGIFIFYQTSVAPSERRAADRNACEIFNAGELKATSNAVSMAEQTTSPKDSEIAQKYFDTVYQSIKTATSKATQGGLVYSALEQLDKNRSKFDASKGISEVVALKNQFTPLFNACKAIAPNTASN